MSQNILVTGASGYLGSEVIQVISKDARFSKVVGVDIRPKPFYLENCNFVYRQADVRSHEDMLTIMKEFRIDTVVHLASIVTPGKKSNREFEYSVDVLGTKNILDCCIGAGVQKIIVTSSGAAYGYHADNPEWIDENDPIRGNYEFAYSHHKKLVEEMLLKYRNDHKDLKQLIFRPGTVLGITTQNQITDLFKKRNILGIKGAASPFVFIWDQDVVNCIVKGIVEDKVGIYNLAGDGALSMFEISKILKKPYVSISPKVLKIALTVLHKLRLTQYGPEQLKFLQFRPVLSNRRLKEEFGYVPQKTSKQAFLFYLENNKGVANR